MLCLNHLTEGALLEVLDHTLCFMELAPDGTVVNANGNFLHMFGYEDGDLIGKTMQDLFSREQLDDGEYHRIWDYIRTGHTFSGQVEMTSAPSSTRSASRWSGWRPRLLSFSRAST